MIYFFFRLLLAISSTSLLPIIYFIKSRYYFIDFNSCIYLKSKETIRWLNQISLLGYLILPFILIIVVLFMVSFLSKDEFKKGSVESIENATNGFLPSYLGYFFIALSIPDHDFFILFVIWLILGIFVFISQVNYFNPIFFDVRL